MLKRSAYQQGKSGKTMWKVLQTATSKESAKNKPTLGDDKMKLAPLRRSWTKQSKTRAEVEPGLVRLIKGGVGSRGARDGQSVEIPVKKQVVFEFEPRSNKAFNLSARDESDQEGSFERAFNIRQAKQGIEMT